MYDTPRHLKVPSLLIAISLSWLCTFVSFEAATPFEEGTELPFESVLPSPWGRCNADSHWGNCLQTYIPRFRG